MFTLQDTHNALYETIFSVEIIPYLFIRNFSDINQESAAKKLS